MNNIKEKEKRTSAKLQSGEVLTWTDLLKKYNIFHVKGRSAHTEWDTAVSKNSKLPHVDVVYFNDVTDQVVQSVVDSKQENLSQPTSKRRPIDKAVRSQVWRRYWDTIDGKCWVCARPIAVDLFEAGHIIAVSKGGEDDILNLVPICGQCNKSMQDLNLIEYKNSHFPGDAYKVESKIQPEVQVIIITKEQVVEKLMSYARAGKDTVYFERAIELLQEK